MVLKLLGGIVIVLSGGVMGRTVANGYDQRPMNLQACQQGLQMLETEITYTATPLPEAWARLSKVTLHPINKVYETAAQLYSSADGDTAGEVWIEAWDSCFDNNALTWQDVEIIKSLGAALGASLGTDQTKHLNLTITKLQQQEAKARKEAEQNVKQWRYLGFLGGMVLTLLII